MPLGYQNRFRYGTLLSAFGTNGTTPFDISGFPLIGYESVYTYRSGKRAKELSNPGNSITSVLQSGSLADRLRRRTEFLNQQISELLTPTTGSTAAFCVDDTGHPFASFKVSGTQPYARAVYRSGLVRVDMDVSPPPFVPYPNWSDPLGLASTDRHPATRQTYFSWPATYPYGAGNSATEIITNGVKNSIGTGVIASANPWKPKATLAQTILELLTGDVPTIFKNLRRYINDLQDLKKSAGSDWLNFQFGWVPLANDIRATIETLLKLHMLLYGSDDARRTRGGDLGTWTRNDSSLAALSMQFGSPFGTGRNSPQWQVVTNSGTLVQPAQFTGGTFSRSVKIHADFRFTARYHRGARPNGRERGFLERATELLGLELTPAVLWELTPWTWLLDWASNLGALASNISLLDWSNVLLDYAYLTFVVKTDSAVTWQGPTTISPQLSVSHGYIAKGFSTIEKVREQASPYGFSVGWTGLNAFQLSILAALGMSRGR
jgi:hypothetical protein